MKRLCFRIAFSLLRLLLNHRDSVYFIRRSWDCVIVHRFANTHAACAESIWLTCVLSTHSSIPTRHPSNWMI